MQEAIDRQFRALAVRLDGVQREIRELQDKRLEAVVDALAVACVRGFDTPAAWFLANAHYVAAIAGRRDR